ncbi:MAG TPA: hypothetical protein VG797_07070 [Phycisphaerales bacterium]|nr:hypothetical protein [Phycisphaerales bacterium]
MFCGLGAAGCSITTYRDVKTDQPWVGAGQHATAWISRQQFIFRWDALRWRSANGFSTIEAHDVVWDCIGYRTQIDRKNAAHPPDPESRHERDGWTYNEIDWIVTVDPVVVIVAHSNPGSPMKNGPMARPVADKPVGGRASASFSIGNGFEYGTTVPKAARYEWYTPRPGFGFVPLDFDEGGAAEIRFPGVQLAVTRTEEGLQVTRLK